MKDYLAQNPKALPERRYEFVLFFEVTNGNPNGDPDGDNAPRVDPETGHGLVADVCLKRKVRNAVVHMKSSQPPYDIYVKQRGILAREQKKAYQALGVTEGSDRPNMDARAWMCRNYYDVRGFGAVMTTGKDRTEVKNEERGKSKGKVDAPLRQWNCGQVRGPIQFSFSRSIDPIVSLQHTITRVALTNADDTDRAERSEDSEEKAATGQMGRKHAIPYSLYRTHIFFSPSLAKDTGFTNDDLSLFIESLNVMFEFDHSAARAEMGVRALYAFEHSSSLGNAPSFELFDLIKTAALNNPARSFKDYRIDANISGTEVKPGVKIWKLI